jgi:hypothetical protein
MHYKKKEVKNHPHHPGGRMYLHRWIVEQVLGKYLDKRHEVHHIDHDKHNNRNDNYVVCEDRSYHKMLHVREIALKASGNPNYRKCKFCGEHDDIKNMYHHVAAFNYYHRGCRRLNDNI